MNWTFQYRRGLPKDFFRPNILTVSWTISDIEIQKRAPTLFSDRNTRGFLSSRMKCFSLFLKTNKKKLKTTKNIKHVEHVTLNNHSYKNEKVIVVTTCRKQTPCGVTFSSYFFIHFIVSSGFIHLLIAFIFPSTLKSCETRALLVPRVYLENLLH